MAKRPFAPRSYNVRTAFDLGRRNGATINPPRLAEIGGMTTKNADQREADLSLKKPGGTR